MTSSKLFSGFFSEIKTIPPILQSSFYPSLNGLRGIAIIMVVLSHLKLSSWLLYSILFNGELGVLIFFVLSGFLITTLCIKEKVTTNTISLKDFYIRRALRIFPVAYLYILVLIILNYVFKLGVSYLNILGAALYVMNFSSYFRKYNFAYQTSHYWSLSVEEQFYLIVPFILKKNYRVYLIVILFIVFALPILISLQYLYEPLNNRILYVMTHYLIKFQAIAVGCLFSVLTFKYPLNIDWVKRIKILTNIFVFALILWIRYDNFFSVKSIFSSLLISISVGYIIVTNIIPAKDIIFKILNAKYLELVGVLSYSIYIWQQIFTVYDKRLPSFMVVFPFNIISLIIISSCSYYFYERSFLKLKSRFSRVGKPLIVT